MSPGKRVVVLVLLVVSCLIAYTSRPLTASATTGINSQISFTGKLVKSDNTNITDGTYNMEFKVYQDGTSAGVGSTLMWTEDYLVAGSTGMPSTGGVTFSSGTFSVNLGSICAFAGGTCGAKTNTGVDFNQNTLWISVQVGNSTSCTVTSGVTSFNTACGGDGEMSPYIRLTAVPYAANASLLDGIDSTALGQLAINQTWTGTNTFQPTANITSALIKQTSVASPTADIFNVQSANATNLLQFTGSAANVSAVTLQSVGSGTLTLNASGTGLLTIGNTGTASNIQIGNTTGAVAQTINIGNNATASSSTAITIGNAIGATGLTFNSGTAGTTFNQVASGQLLVTSGSNIPSVDQVAISNVGSTGVVTAGVSALQISYKGGAAAVEASGVRIDFTPGGTTGGTWNGLRIVANATGAVTGVTEYGLKLEGPTTPGTGTETGAYIGTGWDIGLDLQSGGMQLAAISDPASPAAGNLRIYAKTVAGRVVPKWKAPSGVDTAFQASLGFNRIATVAPNGGTTLATAVGAYATAFTNVGTVANPTPAATNALTSTRRTTFSTGTTAAALASHRQSTLMVWRGNNVTNAPGGFFFSIRFGTSTLATGNRAFIGLADSVAAPTNVDPTTSTTPGKIGMAINASTGNWNWVNNITGTAPTVTALGASFPLNATDLYELVIYSPPNGTSITYRITDISTGAQTADTAVSTNIPAATTFLAPLFWITNNATAAAAIIDFGGWYLESDQ